jgi:hypothetical protein
VREIDQVSAEQGKIQVKNMRHTITIGILAFLLAGCLQTQVISESDGAMSGGPAATIDLAADDEPESSARAEGSSKLDPAPAHSSEIAETAVIEIPLAGDINQANAELSGLAWYGDWLILLPQYPDFPERKENGRLFALPRADLIAYLDGEINGPLQPQEIAFVAPGIWQTIRGYEGFEAIAFQGNQVFLTIEASPSWGMIGYLVKGEIEPDLSQIVLDTGLFVPLPSASGEYNKADEALLVAGDEILSIHEANGRGVNETPIARAFDQELESLGSIPFPHIEYRITDATGLDANGRFWAVNYFFPGELGLRTAWDPIAETYGEGPTHVTSEGVARLLELQYSDAGITLVDQPPLQLELHPLSLHNWEGIARLEDRGFLLVTDKFPSTILGFVPHP